ncbi:GTP cyclohydrolase FolE2 [Mycolicibacterium palauense]|uniref:GTP cyclohydrolase FolE2 n=1 Tax=Mycolicibacterium palauense TaxID=2034511 RepID=UPI001C3F3713|nr:GTP cyclohydrolase FolE2 [Mycolicibacterium palauense]
MATDDGPFTTGHLDWVGMDEIAMPLRLDDAADALAIPARVRAAVNLAKPSARGIHMSRLYLHVDRVLTAEPLSQRSLRHLLGEFLESHARLSDHALLRASFPLMLRRAALRSRHSGWRNYPVTVEGVLERGQFTARLSVEVAYSSTCPASAALARQEIQDAFLRDFPSGQPLDHDAVRAWLGSHRGICATPHSQRSVAQVQARLAESVQGLPLVEMIDRVERALATPVQGAVKREDEQAFALLNGANLMFCEDAARRVQAALDADDNIADFHVRVSHLESLHAHDAVAEASKGIAGGY